MKTFIAMHRRKDVLVKRLFLAVLLLAVVAVSVSAQADEASVRNALDAYD
ncbi:MAG TPA: hypothetical protein VOA64_13330 [Candidatus Dormibacteraeota bacterium]|nr:hypothetical protein [Candidatus Dormibacteraeota bacterium]